LLEVKKAQASAAPAPTAKPSKKKN